MTIEGSRGAGHVRAPMGRKLLEGPAGRRDAEATARKDWRKPIEGAARSDIVGDMDRANRLLIAAQVYRIDNF